MKLPGYFTELLRWATMTLLATSSLAAQTGPSFAYVGDAAFARALRQDPLVDKALRPA